MHQIRAKMVCEEVAKNINAGERVKLRAVYGDTPENKSFSKWTPSATVEMQISNPAALGAFVPGAEYYLDFTPAA